MSKQFTFSQDGLSYTVTLSQNTEGAVIATVTMIEGSMDVNAIYWGDDDFSGPSANLGGPLNMNGGGTQFEGARIQWDNALALSSPGLGRAGQDKETFLQEGQSLTFELDGVASLDDIDFIGIRATSVNGSDSIKAVSGNPDSIEDPGDPEEPEDPETYDKVAFGIELDDGGRVSSGLNLTWDAVSDAQLERAGLEPDAEGTFANYLAVAEANSWFDITEYSTVILYGTDDDGRSIELFRLESEGDTFADSAEVLAAYDAAVADRDGDLSAQSLMTVSILPDDEPHQDADADTDADVDAFG